MANYCHKRRRTSNGELLSQATPNFEIDIAVVIKLSSLALLSSNIKSCFHPLESVYKTQFYSLYESLHEYTVFIFVTGGVHLIS